MSVLIRGMEMPNRCLDCPLMVSRDNDECIVQSEVANEIARTWEDLKANCPLVEVPTPHGRLIDADAFDERVRVAGEMSEEELTEDFKDGVQAVLYMLSKQPTIIEAEGSDT